jgi:hypothetical protein
MGRGCAEEGSAGGDARLPRWWAAPNGIRTGDAPMMWPYCSTRAGTALVEYERGLCMPTNSAGSRKRNARPLPWPWGGGGVPVSPRALLGDGALWAPVGRIALRCVGLHEPLPVVGSPSPSGGASGQALGYTSTRGSSAGSRGSGAGGPPPRDNAAVRCVREAPLAGRPNRCFLLPPRFEEKNRPGRLWLWPPAGTVGHEGAPARRQHPPQ